MWINELYGYPASPELDHYTRVFAATFKINDIKKVKGFSPISVGQILHNNDIQTIRVAGGKLMRVRNRDDYKIRYFVISVTSSRESFSVSIPIELELPDMPENILTAYAEECKIDRCDLSWDIVNTVEWPRKYR